MSEWSSSELAEALNRLSYKHAGKDRLVLRTAARRLDPLDGTETRCPACGHQVIWPSHSTHPEDVATEASAKAKALLMADAFAQAHQLDLARLIATYGDMHAHALLVELRERFWGTDEWDPPEREAQ